MAQYQEKPAGVTVQPQGTPNMSTAGVTSKNVKGLPLDANGERDWSISIFGCFGDVKTCCLASWCPCLAHARNKRRLQHLNQHGRPDPDRDGLCGPDGWAYGLLEVLCDVGWILQIETRKSTRARYGIRGSGMGDCMTALCCQCCDLVQGSQEIELEENYLLQQGAGQV